ncbi:hypothetical protein GGR38_004141 [Novosphingobium sediminicola]|uniref:Uncharacterized protein n=1 Tax=Novosphingobium sediminicola TaxID=563162 RepID=A0A7W6CJU3_9SPHN|nr:hypothetical protein [Novosphingobium sediminicola]
MADISVDARDIGPVAFHKDKIETMGFDQTPRNRSTRGIELMGSMSRLAKQDDSRIPKPVKCIGKIGSFDRRQRLTRLTQPTCKGRGLRCRCLVFIKPSPLSDHCF